MAIIQLNLMLPHVGQARALRDGRAWFLMQDTSSGRNRLTDDPAPASREFIAAVYSPLEGDWRA